MTMASPQTPDITDAHLAKSKAALSALEALGGIWPAVDDDHLPAGFLEGMARYDAGAIVAIISNALPKAPAARAWPWVARALYVYESGVSAAQWYSASEANANVLVLQIAKQAKALSRSLTNLAWLSMRSDDEAGAQHVAKALETSESMRAVVAVEKAGGLFAVGDALRGISGVCGKLNISAASGRRRGSAHPHLVLLVTELSNFWTKAAGTRPSASDPARKDGEPGPFVRLVNGCLGLASEEPATPWQVKGAIDRAEGIAPK